MDVLVTGGAGFLGSHLCNKLIEQGHYVDSVDNLSSGYELNIEHLLENERFVFIKKDILDFDPEKKYDVIYHFASMAARKEWENFAVEVMEPNVIGTYELLESAKEHKSKFIFASTCEIYGDPEIVPTPEEYPGKVSCICSRAPYDESKRVGETFVYAYRNQFGVDAKSIRFFNVYGPKIACKGEYGRVIPRFILQAMNNEPITVYGDGLQTRSFTYIDDAIEGVIKFSEGRVINPEDRDFNVVNLGNPEEITIIDLAKTVKKVMNSESEIVYKPLPEGDPKRRCPDIKLIKWYAKWSPNTTLEKGLEKTIEWFRKEYDKYNYHVI
jgi:UDP-glucuronate decarboxylase